MTADAIQSTAMAPLETINVETLPTVSFSNAPTGSNVVVSDSSFFKRYSSLPSLEEVRHQAGSKPRPKEGIAVFDDLGLLVKFGLQASIEEGQCLYTVRRVLGTSVPVPEVYAWCKEGEETFIFMELIDGLSLKARWADLNDEERYNVVQELRGILHTLREAKQDSEDQFVGHICRTPLQDIAFPVDVLPNAGPFPSVKEFHDWFSFLYRRHLTNPNAYPQDPYRSSLPDDASIVLTHGDLHRSNIMVTESGPPRILALIDWHQAGWLPAYWEVCKAMYTADPEDEWARKYVPQFLQRWEETEEAWDFYVLATGN